MFVLLRNVNANDNDDFSERNHFDKYYVLLVEIKDFNVLINNKPLFEEPINNKQEVDKKISKMLRNNYYTTRNILYYLKHHKSYKLIDLIRQTNTGIPKKKSLKSSKKQF